MQVLSSFEIPASPDDAWALLVDTPRVIPCMPGAELVETVADDRWKARLRTRLGPVSLEFDLDVVRERIADDERAVTLTVDARERSGRGAASATVESRLEHDGSVTTAEVATELRLTGVVARFGRQSLVRDVAAQMTDQFAANLRRELLGPEAAAGPADRSGAAPGRRTAPTAAPSAAGAVPEVSAGRMILGILLRSAIRRLERWLARVERTPG